MKLIGKRLLVITAHPDDESYCAAGTLFFHAHAGAEIFLICLTKGEKGTAHVQHKPTGNALKQRRSRELRAAARVLGIRRLVILDAGDGSVRKRQRLCASRVQREARTFKPDVVLGFGPDGLTGHWDHIAAGTIAHSTARRLHIPFFAFTLPPALTRRSLAWLTARRVAPYYVRRLRYARPTHRMPVNAAVKKRALRCHRSQMDGPNVFTGYPAYAVHELLRAEYFVQFPR